MKRRLAYGVVPSALVGAEIAAYYHRRQQGKGVPPKLAEGSLEWSVERDVSSLDLVFTRRKAWKMGPLTGLASRCVPGIFDSVGVVVTDAAAGPRILEAHLDGSVSLAPFAARLADEDVVELGVRTMTWPDRNPEAVHLFATGAMLQAGADPNRPRLAWRACVDARFAAALRPRDAWPVAPSDATLGAKLDLAVSPAATLVVELFAAVGVLPAQHRAAPFLPSDFAERDPPLRKGARLEPLVTLKVANRRRSSSNDDDN